ncbi:MAG: hypothetical protein EAX81_02125 [Candidatus Thorarchaeota archaeon]|nr:hypothetical protein [Candidatus Thorarchaeota archaeon]
MVKDDARILEQIRQVEEEIESTMWSCRNKEDYQAEIRAYQEVKEKLEGYKKLPENIEKERDRVLSYCLMRLDEALSNSGENANAIERAIYALEVAKRSKDAVQIARCHLALGIRLLNRGKISEAEKNWRYVFKLAEKRKEDNDMRQVLGWTLFAQAHVVNSKSLYNQAYELLLRAREILADIENYAGLAAIYKLLAQVCSSLGHDEEAEISRKLAAEYDAKASSQYQ